ncbi:hypothetical protein GCM10007888_21950 [Methylobacterium oxalidis]|uniref:Uncharacterized protein n=1 Tax=Methylobacterium oxalidis TaxID=944322 RepID=A0ABQ6DIM1_9HYPH|nr:hypothetical protein GCM10007888_21950 [Methylobacterium oxalidis]
MRCLSGCKAEPVYVDAVLAALTESDRGSFWKPNTRPAAVAPARRPFRISDRRRYIRPGRRDDDDDPPSCPAAAMPRPRTPPSAAALALCIPA